MPEIKADGIKIEPDTVADGDVLLRLKIDRPWKVGQQGDASASSLQLWPNTDDDRYFVISSANRSNDLARFKPNNTAADQRVLLLYSGGLLGIGEPDPKAKVHGIDSTILGCENAEKIDEDLGNSQVNIFVDEVANNLTFKVKYSDGTVKSGTVALT